MKTIHVKLAERSYDILIAESISQTVANWITEKKLSKRLFIITNTTVASFYLASFKEQFDQSFQISEFICEDGEYAKSLNVADEIYTDLIEFGADRQTLIIALGGGVVGDLAGFVAATYLRSVPFIQVPTTLLAQVDSSVGGKVAVNHRLGKNMIGAFYQPKVVFIDPLFLKTLPHDELVCGLAECVKYGYIWDKPLLEYIKNNRDGVLAANLDVIEPMIHNCITIKRDIVEMDEKETGQRALLNFGHTFAHALETAANYEGIKHGEAVISGMICALYASSQLHKHIDYQTEKKFLDNLYHYQNSGHQSANLIEYLKHDKKVEDNEIKFILLKSIGVAYKDKLENDLIHSAFAEIL